MTIRLRLTLYWAAVLAVALAGAGVCVYVLFARLELSEFDGVLAEEADTAATALARIGPSGAAAILEHLSAERDLAPRRRVRLIGAGGRALYDFGDLRAEPPQAPGAADRIIANGRRGAFRYAIVRFKLDGRDVWLQDGADARAVRGAIARLRASLLLILPLLLAGCALGGWWLAGRALVPIKELRARLDAIGPGDLSARLDRGRARDEIARLAGAINELLARVETAARRERRFIADAAHELRTPLAVLRTGLEVALGRERTAADYADALRAALDETIGLCAMAGDLLELARLDSAGLRSAAPVDLATLASEAMAALAPLAGGRRLSFSPPPAASAIVTGDREQLRRVIVNLLDNAVKFTTDDGAIAVAVASGGDRARLTVRDDGPGVSDAELPRIFDRFYRGRSRSAPGAGLGLSLCREIAERHGGELAAENNPEGGARFTLSLPLDRAAPQPRTEA